jgi:hypothetical protein
MAEPARQLPDDLDEELVNDPDVIDIRDQLAQDADDPDVIDIRDQLASQDQPYTKERHEQNVNDIKEFFGKNEPKEKTEDPNKQEEKPSQQPGEGDVKPASPEPPPVIPPPKAGESSEAAKPDTDNKNTESAANAAEKVKAGKGKFGQIMNKAQQGKRAVEAGKDIKENSKEYAKEVAKEEAKKAAKQYAKQIARQAGAAIKKAAVQLATKNPWVLGALAIVLIVIIIVAVIFMLFSFNGSGGKGPGQYPETALQFQKANVALGLGGDDIGKDTVIKDVIDSQLARYDRMRSTASRFSPSLSSAIASQKVSLETKLKGMLAEKDLQRRKDLRDAIQKEMTAFEQTLPFGSWIAKLAEERVNQPNTQFCTITGADAKVACASFTSTVLYLAGVPNPIVGLVDDIWRNPDLKIVVARPVNKSGSYYASNVGKLKPGDIIFWGDGACSPAGSVLFDHVGFFVGNGQAIDTSSSQEKILKRPAADRGSCRVFNGAKRYGS